MLLTVHILFAARDTTSGEPLKLMATVNEEIQNRDYVVEGIRSTREPWITRARPLICAFVPAFAVVCFLSWCFLLLQPDFSWDDAEPEILDQAWRLARGADLYHAIDSPPYAIPIYPPLYLGCVAVLLKWTGLSYLPARLLSLVAGFFVCWALIHLNKVWNQERRGGLWAAFFLFLIPAFLYNVLRSHVQMMAVAFSLWSFVFFIRNRRTETLVLSPLLAILAVYTKQTQIALPIAMALYLAVCRRRWLVPYIVIISAGALIPFFLLQKITGGLFFLDTVELARLSYDVLAIPSIFLHHAGPILIFIVIACCILWKRLKNSELEPVDYYFLSVLVLTLASLGRVGAHGQYVVELLVVTVAYLLRTTGLPAIRGRDAWVSVQVLMLFLYAPGFIFFEEGIWARAARKASREVYSYIGRQSGPILSQQGSFALFSRGEIYMQLFHFSALSRAGKWDQSHIVDDINRQAFSHVITEFPIEHPVTDESSEERFTPEVLSALRKNYRAAHFAYPYHVYSPGREGGQLSAGSR